MIVFEQQIGAVMVRAEGTDLKAMIAEFAFLGELPTCCPICQAGVSFQFRMAKTFRFYGMVCTARPAHQTTFGQYREGGILFYKGDDSWGDAYGLAGSDDEDEHTAGQHQRAPADRGQRQDRTERTAPGAAEPPAACDECGVVLNRNQALVSGQKFGRHLCPEHQRLAQPRNGPPAATSRPTGGPGGGSGPATPPAPPAPRAPADGPPASEKERELAVQWVDYVFGLNNPDEGVVALPGGEFSNLTVELSKPDLSEQRCTDILLDMEARAKKVKVAP